MIPFDLELFLSTRGNIVECELETHFQIRAGLSTRRSPSALLASAWPSKHFIEHTPAESGLTKDISKLAENIFDVCEVAEISSTHAVVTELIIPPAFVWITQRFVCFSSLLEFFFRLFVAGIPVGMMLESEFSVRLFDIVLRRLPSDSKDFIEVLLCHYDSASSCGGSEVGAAAETMTFACRRTFS
jgi:hypothetical protein